MVYCMHNFCRMVCIVKGLNEKYYEKSYIFNSSLQNRINCFAVTREKYCLSPYVRRRNNTIRYILIYFYYLCNIEWRIILTIRKWGIYGRLGLINSQIASVFLLFSPKYLRMYMQKMTIECKKVNEVSSVFADSVRTYNQNSYLSHFLYTY